MSRTDKTRPYWVQLRDPDFPWPIRARHSCVGTSYMNMTECDLDFPLPRTRTKRGTCEHWPRYRDNEKIYGHSRWRRRWGSFQDGRARADLRRLKARWLKETDDMEIDSTENLPTSRWRWRRWYWD